MQRKTLSTGRHWLRMALFPAAAVLLLQVANENLWAHGNILWALFLLGLVFFYSRLHRAEFDEGALYLTRWGSVTTIHYADIIRVGRTPLRRRIRVNAASLIQIDYRNGQGEAKRFYYAVPLFYDNSKDFTDAVRAVNPGADVYRPGNFQF